MTPKGLPRHGVIRRILSVFLGSAAVWAVLTGAALSTLAAGVLVAVAVALVLASPLYRTEGMRLRVGGLLLWLPGYLWRTFVGALDVARRVLSPRLPIAPHFVDLPTTFPDGPARAAYTGAMSLTPGSLGAGSFGETVRVHLLSDDESLAQGVRDEERRLRRVITIR